MCFTKRKVLKLISYSDYSELTAAQRISDESFIRSVRDDLRPALINDLTQCIPKYDELRQNSSELSALSGCMRVLVAENEPFHDKGDRLLIKSKYISFYAYAGIEIMKPSIMLNKNGNIEYHHQCFDPQKGVYLAPGKYYGHNPSRSLLKMFLYDELPDTWPKFAALPIAYKVAAICEYINENVVAIPEEITSFVLGLTDTFKTRRFIFRATQNVNGEDNGWVIRIRDLRPTQDFGKYIADAIKDYVWSVEEEERKTLEYVERTGEKYGDYRSQLEPKEPQQRRAGSEETQTLVAFVDDLKSTGVSIGRGGDISWDKAAEQLSSAYGISRTGRNLRDSYNSYKKRHPQQKPQEPEGW